MVAKRGKGYAARKTLKKQLWECRWIYVLGIPGLIVMFLMFYMPMRGLLMAFQDYNPHVGILGSPWVGLKHFKTLFADPKFYNML